VAVERLSTQSEINLFPGETLVKTLAQRDKLVGRRDTGNTNDELVGNRRGRPHKRSSVGVAWPAAFVYASRRFEGIESSVVRRTQPNRRLFVISVRSSLGLVLRASKKSEKQLQ
jgi:hypothetical protein